LRLTVASLTIEQINQDRESFLESIRKNVEPELNKIGLFLINVNITDITDGSNYIESIGKKAAAEAINVAKVDVSVQEKNGPSARRRPTANRPSAWPKITPRPKKGKKKAEADKRVYVQQQEAEAIKARNRRWLSSVFCPAAGSPGRQREKKAVSEQRIYVQEQEALAVSGENKAKADIANAEAVLAMKRAEALQKGEVAKRQAEVEIQKAQYLAEQQRLNAEVIVRQEIEKQKIEIDAEALAKGIAGRPGTGRCDPCQIRGGGQGNPAGLDSKAAGTNPWSRAATETPNPPRPF